MRPCLRGTAAPSELPPVVEETRRGLASRRSTAALATPMKAMAQPQAALRAIHFEQRRYLRLGSRSQRCTSHTGHSAGWSMPRAARERGYEPHPQEPHPPRQTAVTDDVPRWASMVYVTDIVTIVKPACHNKRDEP